MFWRLNALPGLHGHLIRSINQLTFSPN
jgi:hypothetical protein